MAFVRRGLIRGAKVMAPLASLDLDRYREEAVRSGHQEDIDSGRLSLFIRGEEGKPTAVDVFLVSRSHGLLAVAVQVQGRQGRHDLRASDESTPDERHRPPGLACRVRAADPMPVA